MTAKNILAIDQGTTSSRAVVFDGQGRPLAQAQKELAQLYPADGWVEQDAEVIWSDTVAVCQEALGRAGLGAEQIKAIGLTNQRETTILWDRASGEPLYPAIVWQDRRTVDECRRLREAGVEELVRQKTGLLLDPYFSATKLAWLLDNLPQTRERAEKGELAFGTVDSFLLFRLTGGAVHATDATNASRTMLFNIQTGQWDEELLRLFDIPAALLPQVKDSAADFGLTRADVLGRPVLVAGVAGDQQAALVGQACFEPGQIKSTYGTGCFVLMNTGRQAKLSTNRLLTTIAYRLAGQTTYALEGSIFNAGTAIQWLRDGLQIIADAAESDARARSVADNGGVYLVPAFTGLGAPYWDPQARGSVLGLSRETTASHLIRAALEAQGYQTRDLLEAMAADSGGWPAGLRIDGGMAANDWMSQFLADITNLTVERPAVRETTALGAAYLAGLQTGLYPNLAHVASIWQRDRLFKPTLEPARCEALYAGWKEAVARVLSNPPGRKVKAE